MGQCRGALAVNPEFNPDLLPFDLTRGGSPFAYSQVGTIKQQAAYVQDDIKAGNATFKLGLRLDHYDGLTTATLLQPRLGVSYAVPPSNTVLRASYGRTMETPYNENLLLSSGVGAEALFGDGHPSAPGTRNQVEVGIQQGSGMGRRRLRLLQQAHGQRLRLQRAVQYADRVSRRVGSLEDRRLHRQGQSRRATEASARSSSWRTRTRSTRRPASAASCSAPCDTPECSFRIDHDQKFNATTNLQYVFHKPTGAWAALSWRYDSGLVSSAIGDVLDLLPLTPAQQAAAGMSCGGVPATATAGFTSCAPGSITASRLVVPAAGAGDPLNNPTRVAPRHLLDLALGTDNLLRGDKSKLRLRFSIINLTNKDALYNFLSTFSGTHFVAPRTYQASIGWTF